MPRLAMQVHHRRTVSALMATIAATVFTACAPESATAPTDVGSAVSARLSSTVETPDAGTWSRIVSGETGPGSLYRIYVPRDWNGDLVTIAHGFRDVATPVDLRDQDGLYATRDALGAQGFAVAYSSYSTNGFAIKDGAQRTHQLRGLAVQQLPGQPRRHYLLGYSLGGGIVVSLAEKYPTQYAGALSVCGMNGGSLVQTQYLGHVRALFDGYFPGALPGSVVAIPAAANTSPAAMQAAVLGAVFADPNGQAKVAAIASTTQAPLEFTNGNELFTALITGVTFHARGINNIVDLVHGATPFGNVGVTYAASNTPLLPPAVLTPLLALANATVPRFAISPSAEAYLQHHFTPTGDLRIPMITVHNRWDPAVPALHERVYAAAVANAGQQANLSQRLQQSFGHCVIPTATVQQAFTDLTNWVETGVKP